MKRAAFTMKLKPGYVQEYKRRHDEIWPELSLALTKAGISDYSIFLDENTLTLFAVQKLSDNNTSDSLPGLPIMKRWWDYMADIMDTNPDNSPVCIPLKEVFHMD
jgi:L-rhamnose mutarotase